MRFKALRWILPVAIVAGVWLMTSQARAQWPEQRLTYTKYLWVDWQHPQYGTYKTTSNLTVYLRITLRGAQYVRTQNNWEKDVASMQRKGWRHTSHYIDKQWRIGRW